MIEIRGNVDVLSPIFKGGIMAGQSVKGTMNSEGYKYLMESMNKGPLQEYLQTQGIDSKEEKTLTAATYLAAMTKESGGDADAVGDKNLKDKAYGPLQVRKPALEDAQKALNQEGIHADTLSLQNPEESTAAGGVYMAYMASQGGDAVESLTENPELAFARYNGGPNGDKVGAARKYAQDAMSYREEIISNEEMMSLIEEDLEGGSSIGGDRATQALGDNNLTINTGGVILRITA